MSSIGTSTRSIRRRRAQEQEQSTEQRLAGAVTRFTGSMRFVYIHIAVFGTWILWNVGWLGLPPFDSSFVVLAMVASVEAIFFSTFVLISQNRADEQADERADLDLQICLLTEHEVTRLMELTAAIGRALGVAAGRRPACCGPAARRPSGAGDRRDGGRRSAGNRDGTQATSAMTSLEAADAGSFFDYVYNRPWWVRLRCKPDRSDQ